MKFRIVVAGLLVMILALLAAVLHGQEQEPTPTPVPAAPEAVIEGPESPVQPGTLVVLDATKSTGKLPYFWHANLPTPASESSWQVGKTTEFLYFAPGSPGRYAWSLAVGDGEGVSMTQVVITVGDPLPPPVLSIELRDASVSEGDNGGATSGIVSREGPRPDPLEVTLETSDDTEATVQSLVVIPVGEESVGFLVDAVDDQEEDGDQEVVITASATGYKTTEAVLVVTDDEIPPINLSLLLDGDQVDEGKMLQATVVREPVENRLLNVEVTANPADEVSTPPSVTIPAGQASATFVIEGIKDGEEDGDQEILVKVSCQGNCNPDEQVIIVLDKDGTPVVTKLWGYLIYDRAEILDGTYPWLSPITTTMRIPAIAGSDKWQWHPVDDDETDETDNKSEWAKKALDEGVDLPHLYLVNQDGDVVYSGSVPQTVDGVIELVQEHLP